MAGVMGYPRWPEISPASCQRPCTSMSISALANGTAVPERVDTTPDTTLALGTVILVVLKQRDLRLPVRIVAPRALSHGLRFCCA
ncbi:hypothetical protein L917_17769 [Phytophthora nicotianae]|uniref:Uncharacterized protein n=1 Tax=Phytophthora nicotianae TaxID=4792 RepID=W2KBP8_PHYNI|nr:hypothetical protein L917_17769 [Phytophthora nicotianae]